MPSLRFLNAYLYHHNRSSWNDLSLPQLTKTACVSLINEHINLDSLAQAAPRLIYFRLQIEPYRGQFTREFLETYGFNNPEVKHVHVQMTLKKNINFGMLELLPSIVVQGQKLVQEHSGKGRNLHEYSLVVKYFNFV
ncbi:unnamed protein product [Rotaria magnacalcarata]|nr:unnamed protein product [Rotaria magnacalcarata]